MNYLTPKLLINSLIVLVFLGQISQMLKIIIYH